MLQPRLAAVLGALVVLQLGLLLPLVTPAVLAQEAASLTIVPSEVKSTDPVDILLTATFPLGLPFVSQPLVSFNGRDISKDVIPLLGENLVNLSPPEPAIPTSLTITLDGVRFPPGLQGTFDLSFREGTRIVRASFTVDIPSPVGIVGLEGRQGPAASGEALVSILADGGELEVTLSVEGLPPLSTHATAIHRGFCPPTDPTAVDRQGPPVVTLEDLRVGPDGAGSATTRLATTDTSRVDASVTPFLELLSGSYYLNVRSGPRASSASQLCGPLRFPVVEAEADAILEPSQEADAANAGFGTATFLIVREGSDTGPVQLSLVSNITVGELPAGDLFTGHLHSGTCPSPEAPGSLGAPILTLNDLRVDDAGGGRRLTILELGRFASLAEASGVIGGLQAGEFATDVHAGSAGGDSAELCGSLVVR